MAQPVPTRQRVLIEAMRLFGEQGYSATTVAQIESAAGLKSGSGGRPAAAPLSRWLKGQIDPPPELDWDALAAVLMNGVSHYWVLRDALGSHPSGIGESRYLETLVDLVVARMIGAAGHSGPPVANRNS